MLARVMLAQAMLAQAMLAQAMLAQRKRDRPPVGSACLKRVIKSKI
jgi:hypothetical protein